jgi:hypothetical protein
MPGGYFGRRRPVKPSKFLFSIALLLAVGLSVQYFHIVWKSAESIHPINLLLYWLLWMLFPFVLLAIGTLLKKEGR